MEHFKALVGMAQWYRGSSTDQRFAGAATLEDQITVEKV